MSRKQLAVYIVLIVATFALSASAGVDEVCAAGACRDQAGFDWCLNWAQDEYYECLAENPEQWRACRTHYLNLRLDCYDAFCEQ